jgi:hypothetical protein
LEQVVAEVLIAIAVLAAFVVFLTIDVHGKARAFEHGTDPTPPPEAATSVELPSPRFNDGDPEWRRDG